MLELIRELTQKSLKYNEQSNNMVDIEYYKEIALKQRDELISLYIQNKMLRYELDQLKAKGEN